MRPQRNYNTYTILLYILNTRISVNLKTNFIELSITSTFLYIYIFNLYYREFELNQKEVCFCKLFKLYIMQLPSVTFF